MLECLVKFSMAVSAVLQDGKVTKAKHQSLNLTVDQCTALQPLEMATSIFSGQEYQTASLGMPVLTSVVQALVTNVPGQSKAVHDFRQTLAVELLAKFDMCAINPYSLSILCSALDPRFKHLAFLSKADVAYVKNSLLSLLESMATADDDNKVNVVSDSSEPLAKRKPTKVEAPLSKLDKLMKLCTKPEKNCSTTLDEVLQ